MYKKLCQHQFLSFYLIFVIAAMQQRLLVDRLTNIDQHTMIQIASAILFHIHFYKLPINIDCRRGYMIGFMEFFNNDLTNTCVKL